MGDFKVFKEDLILHRMALTTKPLEYTENENGCWIVVNRALDKDGYGKITRNRKNIRTHRYTYECVKGKIPEGMLIMHTCDTPSCINPDHLELGTHKTNHKDRNDKKRQAYGERNGEAKLKEKQVIEIAKLLERNVSIKEISQMFNVDKSTISNIKRKKSWAYLTKDFKFNVRKIAGKEEALRNRKKIIELYEKGVKKVELVKMGFSQNVVYKTLRIPSNN